MATEKKADVISIYSALLNRAQLAARLGFQYGTARDLYKALGYKTTLRYEDFATQYTRQDIAKAVVNRPVEATWSDEFEIVETQDEEETAFEKAFSELYKEMQLKSKFVRLDKLASLGRYGVLMLGLDDVKDPTELANEVTKGQKKLVYLKPLSEMNAKIGDWEHDSSNERYGLPTYYDVTIKQSDESSSLNVRVHHSRVIHVTGETLESDVLGVPALEVVFNRLQDLEKLVGSSAEMFWRGARPGMAGKVDPDFTMTTTMKEDLKEQLDEYENNLRRFIVNEGLELSPLQVQVADPQNHVDVQLMMISAVTGIPKRVLVGTEEARLAGSQDKSSWFEMITARQKDLAEAQIVRPFVDRCVEYGILPKPGEPYDVVWPDMFALSDQQKAELGKVRAGSLQSYTASPQAQLLFPPEQFYEHMLGLEAEDVEIVLEAAKTATKRAMEADEQAQAEQAAVDEENAKNGFQEPLPPQGKKPMFGR